MYEFKGKGIVWDGAGDKLLCAFVDGKFQTEDATVASKLKALGYEVLKEPKTQKKAGE